MYASCSGIVAAWICCGTLFYSLHNRWPLSQAFFSLPPLQWHAFLSRTNSTRGLVLAMLRMFA